MIGVWKGIVQRCQPIFQCEHKRIGCILRTQLRGNWLFYWVVNVRSNKAKADVRSRQKMHIRKQRAFKNDKFIYQLWHRVPKRKSRFHLFTFGRAEVRVASTMTESSVCAISLPNARAEGMYRVGQYKKRATPACHSECLHNGIILIVYIFQNCTAKVYIFIYICKKKSLFLSFLLFSCVYLSKIVTLYY